jgi:protease-4
VCVTRVWRERGSVVKTFVKSFLGMLVAIVVVVALVAGVFAVRSRFKDRIKKHSYLVVDVYGEIMEYNPPGGPFDIMGDSPETVQRILTNLQKAAVDDRIEGVILKMSGNAGIGYASLGEIREAVMGVRDAGKKVYGFADLVNRRIYYLAAACDSIYVPPAAYLNFRGVAAMSMHVKRTLEKLDIEPNIHQIKDYKSAAEMVTREDMSREARENIDWILDDFWTHFMDTMKEDRGFSEKQVMELMEHALFTTPEALEAGLVDRLLYYDELEDMLKREKDEKLRTVSQARYARVKPSKVGLKGKKEIAVVHAQGTIAGRKSKVDPLLGVVMGHESVVKELRKARKDDDIAAIVFRVNSGGGDGLTSDLIARGVEYAAAEKPVVVSMVDVAGSGGYYIAYRASRILADPMTITGSIGSISGKFNMKGFYDKLGITYDFVTRGPMALLFSDYQNFTEEERERFEENHWDEFNLWLADVAERRGMTFEEAEKLAHGRVYTGMQAKANGLIDEVGGLDRAIELAKELADIPADKGVSVVHYPKKKDPLGAVCAALGNPSAVVNWVLYRYIHNDLAETWHTLTNRPLHMMESVTLQ